VEANCLVVARFLKPHGRHGEALVLALTDEPEDVFAVGRALYPVQDDGTPVGDCVVLARARRQHDRWVLGFQGIEDRGRIEAWAPHYLGVQESELRAPRNDELYVHEIPGAAVMEGGVRVATARALLSVPGGELLVVERDEKEHLIPFRPPFVVGIDRQRRLIDVALPPGLFEV
jgi:16S rRNA processing protein RimM